MKRISDQARRDIAQVPYQQPGQLHMDCTVYITHCNAVVCQLFRKPVNLLQKTVGYRITFIHSSDLYFLHVSIHANLLELDHQCVHM